MEQNTVIKIEINHKEKGEAEVILKAENYCLADIIFSCVHLIKIIAEKGSVSEINVLHTLLGYFINEEIDRSNKTSH